MHFNNVSDQAVDKRDTNFPRNNILFLKVLFEAQLITKWQIDQMLNSCSIPEIRHFCIYNKPIELQINLFLFIVEGL